MFAKRLRYMYLEVCTCHTRCIKRLLKHDFLAILSYEIPVNERLVPNTSKLFCSLCGKLYSSRLKTRRHCLCYQRLSWDKPRRIYRRIQTAFLDFMLDVLYPIHNKAKTRLEAVKVKHVLKLFSSLKLPTDACRL